MTQTANMVGVSRTRYVGGISIAQLRVLNTFQAHLQTDLNDTFFSSTDFAEPCTYTHHGNQTAQLYRVIYDDPSQDVNAGVKTEVTLMRPQMQIAVHKMIQVPNINDTVRIRGIDYKIESMENDGVGTFTLFLMRVTGAYN